MTYLATVDFPRRIALGSQRNPRWDTTLVSTTDGRVATIQDWEDALHEFDVSFAVRTADDYDLIVQHFHSARGRRHTFPFRDPLDYRVLAARSAIIDADGDSPTTAFQLVKRYGTGAAQWLRPIRRPKTGTLAIYRLRAGSTVDITGSSTVNYTDGTVTFGGGVYLPGSGDVLTWTGDFDVPCRYAEDSLPALIVDKRAGQGTGGLLVRCDAIKLVEERA